MSSFGKLSLLRSRTADRTISRLAFELLQPNGIDLVGRLCADERLSLPFRLRVVDEALRLKLIARSELNQITPAVAIEGSPPIAAPGYAGPWWHLPARIQAYRERARVEKAEGKAKRRHGALIAARLVDARADDIRIYEGCTGAEFERLVARAFRNQGYRVEEMGGANDGGVDLHVRKDGQHAIVQCKAHARPVGPAVVRELLGTLRHHSTADIAYLATTNGVTASAKAWCETKPIRLLLPDDLIRGRLNGRVSRR